MSPRASPGPASSCGRQRAWRGIFDVPQEPDAVRCDNHRLRDCWLSPDAYPASKLRTLISSSSVGQWIPTPPPISRQFERSSGVPCIRRGYHARGAEIERPSDSSAVTVSPVMVTVSARMMGIAAVGAVSQHSRHSSTKDSINASSSASLDLRHIPGIQQPVELFFGEVCAFAGDFADCLACLVGLFGDLCRFVVADLGGEGRG